MVKQISYYPIFGKPVIFYLGIIALILILTTALLPHLKNKKIIRNTYIWHKRIAIIAVTVAVIHGLMGLLSYF